MMHAIMLRAPALPVLSCLLLAPACTATPSAPLQFGTDDSASIAGLGPCSASTQSQAKLDPDKPVTVLVHGCNASGGRFRALAQVFELHDQPTLCFSYDDRTRVTKVAEQLRSALTELERHLHSHAITVLGHSQGGLVARAALSDAARGSSSPHNEALQVRLVTVSSPFAGVRWAKDCGSGWLHAVTLGTTLGICRVIAGAKWKDIHPGAGLVQHPGALEGAVREHVEIVTDERNTCRVKRLDGSCGQDDYVFSIAEQQNPRVDADQRVSSQIIAAGHSEIVGDEAVEPHKLVTILQSRGVLAPTPEEKQSALQALLERLF
jgi:pimeloyl-ACP methyl ester carboxylesterase